MVSKISFLRFLRSYQVDRNYVTSCVESLYCNYHVRTWYIIYVLDCLHLLYFQADHVKDEASNIDHMQCHPSIRSRRW